MNEFDLEKNNELEAIEFSKLTVGEIYSLSTWMVKEQENRFNRFKSQTDKYVHEENQKISVGHQD